MAEDLTNYLKEMGIRVRYLHSDIATIERADIIRDLRAGVFDVLVGINLLREGLDMPEVSLVAILDADKEGFLRSDTSLIQTIGRAARNEKGKVIMYADRITGSMQRAMDETERRRALQESYNTEHGITPRTVCKEVKDLIELTKVEGEVAASKKGRKPKADSPVVYDSTATTEVVAETVQSLSTKSQYETKEDVFNAIEETTRLMKAAAKQLEFERAAELRDELGRLRQIWSDMNEE